MSAQQPIQSNKSHGCHPVYLAPAPLHNPASIHLPLLSWSVPRLARVSPAIIAIALHHVAGPIHLLCPILVQLCCVLGPNSYSCARTYVVGTALLLSPKKYQLQEAVADYYSPPSACCFQTCIRLVCVRSPDTCTRQFMIYTVRTIHGPTHTRSHSIYVCIFICLKF